jgi:hypothetical protein
LVEVAGKTEKEVAASAAGCSPANAGALDIAAIVVKAMHVLIRHVRILDIIPPQ